MEFKLNEYHRNITNEELLKDIIRVANKLDKDTITRREYVENGGKFAVNTFERRFGGWIKALLLCGLSPNKQQLDSGTGIYTQRYISTEELIEDLQQVSAKLNNKTFSSQEYNSHGKYSQATYFKRFKTWNNALTAAGLVPFEVVPGKRISEYKLLEEIERIWVELGRQPTTTDIKSGISKYSLNTYNRSFGTWRKALEAFVLYINGEHEVDDKSDETESAGDFEYVPIAKNNKPVHKTKRDINLRLRFKVMQRDNFKCCACGASPAKDPSVELHVDHIIPWSKGGETTIDNLQTLCSKCNLGKSNLL